MEPHQLEALFNQAYQEAVKRRHYFTTSEHLLYILLNEDEIRTVFEDLGISRDVVCGQLERFFKEALETAPASVPRDQLGEPTDGVKQLISRVVVQAMSSGRAFPREIDFLIQMAHEKDSFIAAIFKALGLKTLDLMRWASENAGDADKQRADFIISLDGKLEPIELEDDDMDDDSDEYDDSDDDDADDIDGEDESSPERTREGAAYRKIKPYVSRLVTMARDGRIDPVVGRDREINICCQALLRRTKCNVLILGEAGVGKTAIVEGLARRIALEEVPEDLRGAEIYAIDIPSLMAGTKFRGEMEARLKAIIQYVKRRKKAILFIDELHSAAGVEKSTGSQEILALLKPELAKGSMRLIGTTTYEDFRRALSADTALIRRFHKLDVEEPSEETTCRILKEIAEHYEEFHDVSYTSEALNEAVKLSGRFMPERRFPDKAIDVIDEAGAANRMLPIGEQLTTIDVPQIEAIVANIARIPDLQVSSDESSKLKTAEDRMKGLVFGQNPAIESVIRLVKLSRAGIRSPQKPVACLLFAGPTGVGKTEVARRLAEVLDLPFVRFDMSEYREEYTVSKFIGSAPGYVGYERGGLLTEAIRTKPNCVLLLDEIEKAHASIYDLLLQVMDVAKLTDNTGKTADFRHVILIMTSNAGSEAMSRMRIGFGQEIDVSMGMKDIEKTFSPEFRNRLDDIVMFNALSQETMGQIVTKLVHELEMQLSEKGVKLELTVEAREWLAEHGYDQRYGARPMSRLIQKELSVPLSEEILFGDLKTGGIAQICLKSDKSGLLLQIQRTDHSKA